MHSFTIRWVEGGRPRQIMVEARCESHARTVFRQTMQWNDLGRCSLLVVIPN